MFFDSNVEMRLENEFTLDVSVLIDAVAEFAEV
jgi:hypothetical protein